MNRAFQLIKTLFSTVFRQLRRSRVASAVKMNDDHLDYHTISISTR